MVSPMENAGVEHADDIARVGLVDDLALLCHELLRLRQAQLAVALHMVYLGLALKFAGADAHEGQPVAVRFVHVRLNFEHKGGKIGRECVDHTAIRNPRQRRRRHVEEGLQKRLDAEEHWAERARAHLVEIKFASRAQKLHIVAELVCALCADQLVYLRVIRLDLHAVGAVLAGNAGEKVDSPLLPVVDALKFLAAADGPVDGVGLDAQLALQLVKQIKGILGLAVHLIDKGKDRDVPHRADLEQLARLRLDALAAVDDHDRGIRRHQRAVGILGEVLMARRVQNVDAEALIAELHDRRRDGNAALLFNLHPVRHGRAGVLFPLDYTGLRDRSAVEQEFFGQRGLAGIRVRNDCKSAPAADLFS